MTSAVTASAHPNHEAERTANQTALEAGPNLTTLGDVLAELAALGEDAEMADRMPAGGEWRAEIDERQLALNRRARLLCQRTGQHRPAGCCPHCTVAAPRQLVGAG